MLTAFRITRRLFHASGLPAAVTQRAPYLFLALVVAYGAALAVHYSSSNAALGETGLAAAALLRTGSIADPYLLPTGPTAHVSPIHVGLLALVYGLFGSQSAASRIVLSLIVLAVYTAGAAATIRFARRNGTGRLGVALAVAPTCVLMTQLYDIEVGARQWDQPFGALLLVLSLLVATDPQLASRRRFRPECTLAVLAGMAGLVSPVALPAIVASLALTLWSRSRCRDIAAAALSVVVLMALLAPWTIRNELVLGAPIVTRSNFGLELAVGNNDEATGASAVSTLHPHDSAEQAARVAAIGEVAYMAEMRERALTWIVEHKRRFVQLTMRRTQMLILPTSSSAWSPLFGATLAGIVLTSLGILRLVSLAFAVFARRDRFVWLAHCILPLAPYAVTHVGLRYEFPVFFTSVCLISAGAGWASQAVRLRFTEERAGADRIGRATQAAVPPANA